MNALMLEETSSVHNAVRCTVARLQYCVDDTSTVSMVRYTMQFTQRTAHGDECLTKSTTNADSADLAHHMAGAGCTASLSNVRIRPKRKTKVHDVAP